MSCWRTAAPSLLLREDAAAKASAGARIAAFDLNDTLVTSKAGAPGYLLTLADWQYYNGGVAASLRELHQKGFKLVIFTNQGNIKAALDGKRAQAVRAYLDAMLKDLAVPVQVFVATQKDRFRKPEIGMWEFLEQKANAGIPVDRSESFYVGDAAGGPGEHSAADSEFARAVGVRFVHAREYFGPPGGPGAGGCAPGAGVRRPPSGAPAERAAKAPRAAGLSSSQERGEAVRQSGRPSPPIVLVLVGAPGAGKSTFAERLGPPAPAGARAGPRASGGGLAGREASPWRRVCQDLLGSREACLRAASTCLGQGLSVIIDRTNVSIEQREPWLSLAGEKGAVCHSLLFDVPLEECCRRVAARPAHEGGLTGAAGRAVITKLLGLLQPVSEAEPFTRVRIVRTAEECEAELRLYSGSDARAPPSPSPLAPEVATERPASPRAGSMGAREGTALVASEADAVAGAVAPPACKGAPEAPLAKVRLLVSLGFSQAASQAALDAAGGDVNRAANDLLADRLIGE